MEKNRLLKIGIGICLAFAMFRLGESAFEHVPPYDEGQCIAPKDDPLVTVKILKNHILEAYSDVQIGFLFLSKEIKSPFVELRNFEAEKVECP